MKIVILSFLLTLIPYHAFAAKAVAVVQYAVTSNNVVAVQAVVADDSGTVSLSTSFNINFANSINQINADLKIKIRDVLAQYGVNLTVNDIIIFGGAQ